MTDRIEVLEEQVVPGRRLGRNVWHDEQSKAYQARRATQLKSVTHARYIPPLDQGEIGSCTGNAATGLLATAPYFLRLPTTVRPKLNEAYAVQLYKDATRIDPFPGVYTPSDTGSNGLATMKVLKARGLVASYYHCFGLQHTLETLVLQPVSIGIPWYSSFDEPTSGFLEIKPGAEMRGGHQMELTGINVEGKFVYGYNSWGESWNRVLRGRFKMAWTTLDRLLKEQGDVVTAVLK